MFTYTTLKSENFYYLDILDSEIFGDKEQIKNKEAILIALSLLFPYTLYKIFQVAYIEKKWNLIISSVLIILIILFSIENLELILDILKKL